MQDEEDLALKEKIDDLVGVIVGEESVEAKSAALDKLVAEIHGATAVMASVPKPLKFLLPHYEALAGAHPVRAPTGPDTGA